MDDHNTDIDLFDREITFDTPHVGPSNSAVTQPRVPRRKNSDSEQINISSTCKRQLDFYRDVSAADEDDDRYPRSNIASRPLKPRRILFPKLSEPHDDSSDMPPLCYIGCQCGTGDCLKQGKPIKTM